MIIVIVALAGGHASAVTLEDIVELSQAGIGEDVLIELIRMDDVSYPLTPSRLRALKGAGISDRILLALLRSGRPARDDRRAAAQIDDNPTTTRSAGCKPRRVACESVAPRLVPVPVLVPVRPTRGTRATPRAAGPHTAFGFAGVSGFSVPVLATAGASPVAAGPTPVYWGWGGKKRPGSWNGHSARNR